MSAALLFFNAFTLFWTRYSHVLFLCIQASKDFGLTLAYAAPEDVRRLGRGECCGSATATTRAAGWGQRQVQRWGADGVCGCARVQKTMIQTHPHIHINLGPNWVPTCIQMPIFCVHLSMSSLYIYPTCTGFGLEYKSQASLKEKTSFWWSHTLSEHLCVHELLFGEI